VTWVPLIGDKIRRITYDYYDFLLLDVGSVPRRLYVLQDGIDPEGEQVILADGGAGVRGRGVFFEAVEPDPGMGEYDMALLFVPSVYPWHDVVDPAPGEYYVAVGVVEWSIIEERRVKEGPKLLARLRRTPDSERILVAKVTPYPFTSREKDQLIRDLRREVVLAKSEIRDLRRELELERKERIRLERAYAQLQARYDLVAEKLHELEIKYGFTVKKEAVLEIREESEIQELEAKAEKVYPVGMIDRLLRRAKTPVERARERIEEMREEVREVEESEGE